MSHLIESVRAQCAQVAEAADQVSIDLATLFLYPETLQLGEIGRMRHDPGHHLVSDDADEVALYFLALSAVNFGSGYFEDVFGPDNPSGYRRVAGTLAVAFKEKGSPTAAMLASISAEDCARMVGIDLATSAGAELVGLMRDSLQRLGSWLLERFDGEVSGLLASVHSSEEMVLALSEMTGFRDIAQFHSQEVSFYKRAQLFVHDLHIALPNDRRLKYEDVERLTAFADNKLPYVLRADGVLRCSPSLAEQIDQGEFLDAGSTGEVELRACTVHAVELLCEIISEDLRPISPRQLDYVLWHRAKALRSLLPVRAHRTKTIFY